MIKKNEQKIMKMNTTHFLRLNDGDVNDILKCQQKVLEILKSRS